jgi:hypothetical protein
MCVHAAGDTKLNGDLVGPPMDTSASEKLQVSTPLALLGSLTVLSRERAQCQPANPAGGPAHAERTKKNNTGG